MGLLKLLSPGVGKKSFCPCQLLRQEKNILQFFQLMMSKHSANISAEINSQSNFPDINPRLFLIFPLFFQAQACRYPNQETHTTICLQGAFHTRSGLKHIFKMATLVRLLLLVLSSFFYLPESISILEQLSKKKCVEDVVSSRPDPLSVFNC